MHSEQKMEPRLDDTLSVSEHRIACDGGGGLFGHPKVWYDLRDQGEVVCEYCGRKFVYRAPS